MIVRLLCILLLFSCQKKEQRSQRHLNKHLSLNIGTEPPTLDPGLAQDLISANLLKMVFEGLMRKSSRGVDLASAERVEISSDGKIYTFYLRKTYWSNGERVTAYDFEYAWKRQLDPHFPSPMADFFYVIKNAKEVRLQKEPIEKVGIKAVDDKRLVVELVNPIPYFLELVETPPFYPVHRISRRDSSWAMEASQSYITNGPFSLKRWKHHDKITLQRSPYYWDKESVKIEQISLHMIEDSTTELLLFEQGELDWVGEPISSSLSPDAVEELKKRGRLEQSPVLVTNFYLCNTLHPKLKSSKTRRALARAIHRSEIVDNIIKVGAKPAYSVIPPTLMTEKIDYFTESQQKQERLKLRLVYHNTALHYKIAQAVQQQMQRQGIELILEGVEWKILLDRIQNRDFDLASIGYMCFFSDPFSMMERFHLHSSRNTTGWEDSEYSRWIDEAEATFDSQRRLALFLQAEKRLMEEMVAIPLYFPEAVFLKDRELKNVFIDGRGIVDFKNAYFE